MSSQGNKNALALHEILLSISDSLNEAQNELRNMPPYDAYGRPNTIYHLPYLDFSIEMVSEVNMTSQSSASKTSSEKNNKSLSFGRRQDLVSLKYNLDVAKNLVQNQSSNKITSNISGRFVAVLPNEGLPQTYLSVSSKLESSGRYKVIAKVFQAGGTPVVGQLVEINFDRDTSELLSNDSTLPQPIFVGEESKKAPTKEGLTDDKGEFSSTILLPSSATSNHFFVFVANSGSLFSSISINKS